MQVSDHAFAQAIMAHGPPVRRILSEIRQLVLDTAKATPGVGRIEEAMRWNQHSFLTPESGSGSTIRIDGIRNDPSKCAIYFHCQSGLIGEFKELYGARLTFEGKRAIILDASQRLPIEELRHCIALALTLHARKRTSKRRSARETGAASN
jgi:hypothetical protein